MGWEIVAIPSLLGLYAVEEDIVLMIRRERNDWVQDGAIGMPLWSARLNRSLSDSIVSEAKRTAAPEIFGPVVRVMDDVGKLVIGDGDTLRIGLRDLKVGAKWGKPLRASARSY